MPGPYTFPETLVAGQTGEIAWAEDVGAAFNEAASTPTPSVMVLRDSFGRAQFADPAAAQDAATKNYIDVQLPPGAQFVVTAAMSQAQIQAVCTAMSAGSRLRFAPGTYALTGTGLSFSNDDILIDATAATVTQSTWGVPAFDLIGRNYMTLDLGSVQFVGTRGGQGTSTRGQAGYAIGAAVYINGDHNWVRSLTSVNFAVGVNLSGWAGSTAWDHQGVGNRIGRMEVSGMDWGVLWAWQTGLVIDDIYGHDDIDDSSGANPTHVIYGSALTGSRDEAVTIKKVRGVNILTGQAVQVKYSDDLTLRNLYASNCKGVLNLIDCMNLDIDGVTAVGMLANGGSGSFTIQTTNTNSQRPRVSNVSIQLAANVNEYGIMAITDYGEWSKISVESNHSSGVAASMADLNIRGTGNVYRDVRDNQLGTGCLGILVGGGTTAGNSTKILNPVVTGASTMIDIILGSTSVVVDYAPGAQSVTSFVTNTFGAGTETWSTRSNKPTALSTFGENSALALLAATGTVTVGAANSALQRKIRPTRTITVTGLRWWSYTASGNYDIGIVDDATNTLLWSKGTTAWPAAGPITETVTGVTLYAGHTYRLVFAADNATGAVRGNGSAIVGLDVNLDGTTDSTTVSSAFPIPSTLVAGTSGSTTRVALIAVLGS